MDEHGDICDDLDYVEFVLGKKHYKEKFLELEKCLGNYFIYMSRSLKKGPYIDENLMKKVAKQKQSGDRSVINTWSRRSQIAPEFVGHKFGVHNGRTFIEVLIGEGMISHRLGEFSPTRTFRGHGKVTKRVTDKT